MGITIAEPLYPYCEVSFKMSYEDAELIRNIRDKLGVIPAIRVLRMYNKEVGLKQAKEFVEGLTL